VCGLYSQQCSTTSPCCNGVPCSDPAGAACTAGEAGCTCHYPVQ
jgi:hypothetical protein